MLWMTWLTSCSKEVGDGGLATIQGKVYGNDINPEGQIKGSGYLGDARVYISYGESNFVDNETRTSYSGDFRFENLTKGSYTIFVYSQCNSCLFNQEVVIQKAEITETKQVVILPDFVIND